MTDIEKSPIWRYLGVMTVIGVVVTFIACGDKLMDLRYGEKDIVEVFHGGNLQVLWLDNAEVLVMNNAGKLALVKRNLEIESSPLSVGKKYRKMEYFSGEKGKVGYRDLIMAVEAVSIPLKK